MEDQIKTTDLLLEVSEAIASIAFTRDIERVLNLILDKAINLTKAHDGWIRLIDERREYFEPGVSKGAPSKFQERKRRIDEGIAGEVVFTGKSLRVANVKEHQGFSKLLKTIEDKEHREYLKTLESELAVPLKIKDRVIGVLNVHNREKTGAFSKEDEELLMFLANQATIAFENARLLNALQELGIEFTRSTEEKDLLQSISEVACKLLNIPACSIWILDKEKGEFRIKASVGLAKDYVEKAYIGKEDNITGEALRTKEAVGVFDIEQDDRLKYREELIQMGFKSLLAFPLLIKEEGIGTINLYTTYKHIFAK